MLAGLPEDIVKKVIVRVTKHEGGYDSLNLNTDKAGLSFGILQWAQRTGDLGKLLAAMHKADPDAFVHIFGASWSLLLQTTKKGSLDPVGGAVLWQAPWIARFKEAGAWPAFQKAQWDLAVEGVHFKGALAAAKTLGITTERALALFFDTAVQQGAGAAAKVAVQVKAAFDKAGKALDPQEVLAAYAQRAADRTRTTKEPGKPKSSALSWKKVGAEWHLHAGSIDLYQNILKRRLAIVQDPNLSDSADVEATAVVKATTADVPPDELLEPKILPIIV